MLLILNFYLEHIVTGKRAYRACNLVTSPHLDIFMCKTFAITIVTNHRMEMLSCNKYLLKFFRDNKNNKILMFWSACRVKRPRFSSIWGVLSVVLRIAWKWTQPYWIFSPTKKQACKVLFLLRQIIPTANTALFIM